MEKLNITYTDLWEASKNSDNSLYLGLDVKALRDHGNGEGDALLFKTKRRSDKKTFYTIIPVKPKYLEGDEKNLKELIDEAEQSINGNTKEFKEYLPETLYIVKDINGCVSTLSTESDTPIDWIFDCFDSEEENIKLEISKREFYPDQVYEMGEWEP
jgi:hypothetical protein